ncbi:MAG: putative Formyl-CoA transferase [Acidimicrobiia bacterium]|nr:putative Formyl-CoA transferase [Acidimicrobiia bacterium]
MTLPLTGIKIVDFSEHGFVPSCAAVLADWGADVIKIERAQGDAMRTIIGKGMVPTSDGYDFLFELVNRNKRGIALDVEVPEGRAVFDRLVKWADVYITNQLPRVRRKLKTEPADLFALNPRLVFAKGHGQGQRGVDAEAGGFDAVSFWARGSVAHVLTDPAAERPAQQRPALGDVPTGMFFAGGICAAIVHATRTGKGIVVDTSLLNGATWSLGPDMAYASMTNEQLPGSTGVRSPVTETYRTADGRFVTLMMIDEQRYWTQACTALGVEELIEQYPEAAARRADWEPLGARFREIIGRFTRLELEERLRAHDCIYSSLATPPEVVHDDAVVTNGYLMAHPTHPTVRLSAAPAQFDDELPTIRRPAPQIGEHSREILAELGYSTDEIERLVKESVVAVAPSDA